jgi:hypothetical protein
LVFAKFKLRAPPAIDIHGSTMQNPYLPTNSSSIPNSKLMLNPYRKVAKSSGRSSGGSGSNEKGSNNNEEKGSNNKKIIDHPSSTSTMGPQSQKRKGSISKALARGSNNNKNKKKKSQGEKRLVQMGVDGGLAFEANRDCIVCKGIYRKDMGECVVISHHAHDTRCVKNRETRGLSKMTVFVDKTSKNNVAINTMPLSKGHTEGLPSVAPHFAKNSTRTTSTRTTNSTGMTTNTTSSNLATAPTSTSSDKEEDKDKGNKYCRQLIIFFEQKMTPVTNAQPFF